MQFLNCVFFISSVFLVPFSEYFLSVQSPLRQIRLSLPFVFILNLRVKAAQTILVPPNVGITSAIEFASSLGMVTPG